MQSSAKEHLIRLPAVIELMDGQKLHVNVISPRALLRLPELIAREERFLDCESLDGERFILSKAAVKLVRNREIAEVKDLNDLVQDKNGFDPYRILKVEKGHKPGAVREAYHAQVRIYHPDRFASIELPQEVNNYLTAMIRRINMAYDMIENKKAE
jgi:DnaJ-domain-containing protein 1